MSDLTDQVDNHEDRLTALEDSGEQNATDLSQQMDEMQGLIDQLTQQLADDEAQIGQLSFPLSQETIDLIKEQFPGGFATLSGGTVTVLDARISSTSNIFISVSQAAGTQGFLSYAATSGQVVITSTSATETSIVSYLILN